MYILSLKEHTLFNYLEDHISDARKVVRMLKILFAILSTFLYVKPLSVLIILIPKI